MASLDNVIEITQLLKLDQIDFFLLTVENFSGKPKFFVDYLFQNSAVSIQALRHINLELAKIIKTEEDKEKLREAAKKIKLDSKTGISKEIKPLSSNKMSLKPRKRKNPPSDQ